MTVRNRDLPPALPCGDDPLVRTCGIGEPSVPEAPPDDSGDVPIREGGKQTALFCRACLPRPAKLVKLEGV